MPTPENGMPLRVLFSYSPPKNTLVSKFGSFVAYQWETSERFSHCLGILPILTCLLHILSKNNIYSFYGSQTFPFLYFHELSTIPIYWNNYFSAYI